MLTKEIELNGGLTPSSNLSVISLISTVFACFQSRYYTDTPSKLFNNLKTIVHLQIWITLAINITLKGDSIPQ
jgi:hypothetical protein